MFAAGGAFVPGGKWGTLLQRLIGSLPMSMTGPLTEEYDLEYLDYHESLV